MMIKASTFQFLRELSVNNNREWMQAHHKEYQDAKSNVIELVGHLMAAMEIIGLNFGDMEPSKLMFRLNRDVRFSANKEPYKTNFGIVLNPRGRKDGSASYYLHIEPGASFLAGGIWHPESSILYKIRQEIAYCSEEFLSLIESKDFKNTFGALTGPSLTRPPKGYDAHHPAIEYIKLKSYTVSTRISDASLQEKQVIPRLMKHYKLMQPFIAFLNRALDLE